ncbi:phosphoglycerate dehydrogenase [Alteromonas sp. ASW11-36]|uniref:Phosphoglycerate dehydrogenase n=1 Tax=Alteromonas arenosi TaxID=3055817 RepID=A0ABT7SVV5_9ALTE|nr:phosphoglycerate dehydrogenase [Alteromonas sp. ASW11-36]MDM7860134.1 phosphoglycerate dehydrogenase [Alteromonas sp. ASW11-36]
MKVAITSKAFANNPTLRQEVESHFEDCRFNTTGRLLTETEFIEFLTDCDGAIVAMEEVVAPVLDTLDKLKVIAKFGVGLNNIDLDYCRSKNIPVKWTAGVNKQSVAEMALGFMLMLSRNLYVTSNQLKAGTWNKSGGQSLYGKTIGIIGFGHIGQELARILQPFNCRLLVNDIIDVSTQCDAFGAQLASKTEIYARADIISLHTPLDDSTFHLFDKSAFAAMQRAPIVLNTARGDLIDLPALQRALETGQISAAAIDVYDQEPPQHPELLSMPNLICTPHIGGNSKEATLAMGRSAIAHLVEHLR